MIALGGRIEPGDAGVEAVDAIADAVVVCCCRDAAPAAIGPAGDVH